MNKKTLAALRGSIKKWEGIVKGIVIDEGEYNCPLCQLFNTIHGNKCKGCPIHKKVKLLWCRGTPYRRFSNHNCVCDKNPRVCKTHKRLAEKELEFLKSLLPKRN